MAGMAAGCATSWPGHVIGGDVFHNFGGRLPGAPGRVYREADLDATCRSRGREAADLFE